MSQEQLIQELISTLGADVVLFGADVPERREPAIARTAARKRWPTGPMH